MVNKTDCKPCSSPKDFKEEVIRVPKVYDWVNDSITVKKEVFFGEEQIDAIRCAMEDPNRRPLRIVAKAPKTPPVFPLQFSHPDHVKGEGFFCEQIGEKREVVVPISGEFVNAELVDLLFNAEIEIEVVDRHGRLVTEACVDVAALEPFVLCYPNGTSLICRIQKILAEITSGTILLNTHVPKSFHLKVTFCVDVQVEAEVKLEVFGRFASSRENNLEPIEGESVKCPPIKFPEQCPDIYPVHRNGECRAKGEASGPTHSPKGRAGILVDINPSGSLDNSVFDFTFDRADDEGNDSLTFSAHHFDPDTFCCKSFKGGLKMDVSGSGTTLTGQRLHFRLALLDEDNHDQFQVQLTDPQTGETVLNTGVCHITEGGIVIKQD